MSKHKDLLEDFTQLHNGNTIAYVKDRIKPVKQINREDFQQAMSEHLSGDQPIGVYPLWERNNVWMVDWVAVDLDEGDISDIHADNLVALLDKLNIKSWKEPSRSKGYHVWVYLKEPLSASLARKGMIGACRTVDVPIREVYPKQTHLEPGHIGNCLRLPYPKIRTKGRQEVAGYKLEQFVTEAMEQRTPPGVYRKLMSLYNATEPAPIVQTKRDYQTDMDGYFVGTAKQVWENPRDDDRSATLYAFAASLIWQEYSPQATLDWVRRLDDRLEKFVGRHDREQQLLKLVQTAVERTKVRD